MQTAKKNNIDTKILYVPLAPVDRLCTLQQS